MERKARDFPEAKTSTDQGLEHKKLGAGAEGARGDGEPGSTSCVCLLSSYFHSPTSDSSIILLQNLNSQMIILNFCNEIGLTPTFN